MLLPARAALAMVSCQGSDVQKRWPLSKSQSMKRVISIAAVLFFCAKVLCAAEYIGNRAPLTESPYLELPLGSIQARGWLLEQLQRQKSGMTGHLDEIYPQVVGARNAWLGGDGDAWERGPYWIDGLLPLAYILDDDELKAKAQVWVEAILGSQKEDGYFGPDTDRPHEPGLQRSNSHDWWPKMVALKIIKQYYMATGDERVIPFLTAYFRYQLKMLPQFPLDHWTYWGAQRGGDNLEIVYWLYNRTGDAFLLDLAELIHRQTTDWTRIHGEGSEFYTQNSLHCVNVAQGFKEPIVYWQQCGDRKQIDATKNAVELIRQTIGLPTGLWAGDEMIHFGDPTRGSELCTAVEMMFSLEEMTRITGDTQWADHLERVAYNALPAQTDDEFKSRQYFHQINQVLCDRTIRNFNTTHYDTDIVFGELNGYPCCTTNMHQGWPKLTQNLWYATPDGGAAALIYAPSQVKISVAGGVDAVITEDTFYPFDEAVSFTVSYEGRKVKSASFPLHLRIPEWCGSAVIKVNGASLDMDLKAGMVAVVTREWVKGDIVTLELPMEVKISRWYDRSAVVERGPLIYALRMNETWTRREFAPEEHVSYGKWYYEVSSDSKWNYCLPSGSLAPENIGSAFTVIKSGGRPVYPWTNADAPVVIRTKAMSLDSWTLYKGSAGPVTFYSQTERDCGEESEIELIPFGCTTLRITEFPVRR